jgi:hypothetical protein
MMNGIDDNSEELSKSFEIIEQFLQNTPADWEDDPVMDIPGVATISCVCENYSSVEEFHGDFTLDAFMDSSRFSR